MTPRGQLDTEESLNHQPELDDDSMAGWMQDRELDSQKQGARNVLSQLLGKQRRARARLAYSESVLAVMTSRYDREFRHIWERRIADDKAILCKVDPDVDYWRARLECLNSPA
jgi:hypothetical protein